jgi:ketosteroid isomerase-like protein
MRATDLKENLVTSAVHTATIREFLNAVNGRRYDEVELFLAEDVRWWFAQSAVDHGLIPSRCAEDRRTVLDYIGRAPTNYRRNELTLLHLLEDGPMVAAHVLGEGQTHAGKDHSNEYIFMFRFADDKIAEVWEFVDTAYIFARFN